MTWDELVAAARDISWIAYLATADTSGRPHVAPVSPGFTEHTVWFGSRASSSKVRNIRTNPAVAFHWPVGSGSGPGELFLRGTATVHDSAEARHRLWTEANLPYDPAGFFQSPDNPDLVFVETAVEYGSVLGPNFVRDVWRPAHAPRE